MNKKLLIGSITAALVLGGTFAVGASELPIFDLKTNKLKYEKEFIPEEQAKIIALNEVNGTVEDVEIEKENGHFYYEVEIDKDNVDYDIFIEAYTGKIAYIRVENDDKIKNMNEVESIKSTNKVEKDDSHDDGTKEAIIEDKPQVPSTSKMAITKTVQKTQVRDHVRDDVRDDDWDDDRDDDDDNGRDDDNDDDQDDDGYDD